MRGCALPGIALVALCGCGARSSLLDVRADGGVITACAGPVPSCLRAQADPCAEPVASAPVCDDASGAWRCPDGAWVHVRLSDAPAVCLPFHTPAGGRIAAVEGSLVRVPVLPDRCLWVAERVDLADGTRLRNVAFEPDRRAPFGTCPIADPTRDAQASVVRLEGFQDPTIDVQISSAFVAGGRVRIFYRLFRLDSSEPFGARELGTGIARWDETSQRIVVPRVSDLRWGPDVDLGHASVALGDAGYAWGCPPPITFLTTQCYVARLDASDGVTFWNGGEHWDAMLDVTRAPRQFDAGPWISSVVDRGPSRPRAHVYAVGFAGSIEAQRGDLFDWTGGHETVADCDLPPGDPHAYCAGPVVHRELEDPAFTRGNGYVVSYGVGTTSPTRLANRDAYWTRLVWATPR